MANTPRVPIRDAGIADQMQNRELENAREGRPRLATGVFAAQPFMSPKYARHRTNRRHEFEDTMARMFIKVNPKLYDKFLRSIKDKDTREVAKVLGGDDINKGGHGYIDFLLQNATHSFSEKVQVSETLSDSYVAFFYGHSPPTFQYNGTVLNTYQDDWAMRMFRIFRDLTRGTQMARRKLVLRLKYDSMIVTGVMTNFQWSVTAGAEMSVPFSFNLLVKDIQVLYGGMSPPTAFEGEGAFTPEDFRRPGARAKKMKAWAPNQRRNRENTSKDLTVDDYIAGNQTIEEMLDAMKDPTGTAKPKVKVKRKKSSAKRKAR